MAKTAEITSLLSNKNFVFDPYNIKSYCTPGKSSKLLLEKNFINVQPESVLHGYRMNSNGLFEACPGADAAVYVYRVPGHVAVLKLSEYKEAAGAKDEYKAFAFFDKELDDYLEKIADDNKGNSCKINDNEIFKTEYLCWHYGTIFNNEMNSEEDWIVVPREIFTDVDDYVYLCICASDKNKPELNKILFPKDCLFFYDLPVATSVYEGQKLGNSKIILGRVMAYLPKTKGIPLSLCGYKECKGKFEWKNKTEVVKAGVNKTVKITQRNDYNYIISGKKISCPSIELYVYKKKPADRQKDITAFVWHSGNEDDIVKKEYLGDDSYNKYSYIQDCLSSDTMYHSYVSLTRLTGENAARYAVRSLAHQPEGNRCFSIDSNHLVYLMGGALKRVFDLLANINKENKLDILRQVDMLYEINQSKLFYDSPVSYGVDILDRLEIPNVEMFDRPNIDIDLRGKEDMQEVLSFPLTGVQNKRILLKPEPKYIQKWRQAFEKAKYYMHDVLGIDEGGNGCAALKSVLTSVFKDIDSLGVKVDYVFCDIEGIRCDAQMLKIRLKKNEYKEWRKVSDDLVFYKELCKELEGTEWEKELRRRGYDIKSDELKHVAWVREVASPENINIEYISSSNENAEEFVSDETEQPSDGKKDDKRIDINSLADYGLNKSGGEGYERFEQRRLHNVWDAVMKGYENGLFREYVFTPVLERNEKTVCSAYLHSAGKGYINYADMFETYLGGDVKLPEGMYSCRSLYGDYISRGFKKLSMDNWKMYPNHVTAYSFFIGHINRLRATMLASEHKFTVFVTGHEPWIYELMPKYDDYIKDEKVKKGIGSIIEETRLYHQELLYHVFLSRPQKVIAYYDMEKSRRERENGNNRYYYTDDTKDESSYFTKSYSLLQKVLEEMNHIVKGKEYIPLENEMIAETNPFVISGIQVGEYNYWRVTLNEITTSNRYISVKQDVVRINISGKIIFFDGGTILKDSNIQNGKQCGCWVRTLKSVRPKVGTIDNYYEKNAAYEIMKDQGVCQDDLELEINKTEKSEKVLRFGLYKNYTVFGVSPKYHALSVRFKITDIKSEEDTRLLYSSAFNNEEGKSIEVNYKEGILQFCCEGKPEKLQENSVYELKLYAYCADYSTLKLAGRVKYELWSVSDKGTKNEIYKTPEYQFVYNRDDCNNYLCSAIELLTNVDSSVKVLDFKIYLSGLHTKLEVFRESDGVNIAVVNKNNEYYKELPVETRSDDTLTGKFSWLNATDKEEKYLIVWSQVTLSAKRRVNIEKELCIIKVRANSEGSKLIALPRNEIKDNSKIIVKAKMLSMVDALYHIKKYPPVSESELNSKEILEVNVNINK